MWTTARPLLCCGGRVSEAVLVPLLSFDHYLCTRPGGRDLLAWALALLVAPRASLRPTG